MDYISLKEKKPELFKMIKEEVEDIFFNSGIESRAGIEDYFWQLDLHPQILNFSKQEINILLEGFLDEFFKSPEVLDFLNF